MADFIEPRTLRGFRDFMPELMIPRERLLEQARQVYRSYGFGPIDTPALELAEILTGKGGEESDKQLYRFRDNGDRDVAMRFDLTVPLARFVAQHIGKLGTPFKRYHMGLVWRGESPQHGRFREFMQCDFDIIGPTTNAADIEIALVIHDLFRALGFDRFQIHVNNRMVLNGLLEELGLAEHSASLLRAIDKLAKAGRDAVRDEMVARAQISPEKALRVIELAETTGSNAEILDRLQRDFGSNAKAKEGITRLRELLDVARTVGIDEAKIKIDVGIARGLDYYTGTIYETLLDDLPKIGSVCSGGRYDNLAGLYTKQHLPGVGASLGLDRLLAAMEELKMLPKVATPAPVLLVQFDASQLGDYQKLARTLRAAGIGVEVFPEAKKIGPQLQYAERKGFQLAIIAGPDELAAGTCKIKDLAKREERTVALAEVVSKVREMLQTH